MYGKVAEIRYGKIQDSEKELERLTTEIKNAYAKLKLEEIKKDFE